MPRTDTLHLSPAKQQLPRAARLTEILRTDGAGGQGVWHALDKARRRPYTAENVRKALQDCDLWLESHGIEYAASTHDTLHTSDGLEYVNAGDTYTPTVIFDWRTRRFLFTSLGDLIESQPHRFS